MISRSRVAAAFLCALTSIGAGIAQGQGRVGGAAERFVLSGVMLYEGGGLAWLQEPSLTGDRIVALRLSDSIGPYRLTKILDDRVELQGPTGTVLIPVYNAQAGPGSAVAMASPGAAPSGVPDAEGRAAGPGVPLPPSASPRAGPPGAQALRDRLEVARRHVEQLQSAGQMAGQQPGQVSAPEASIGRRGAGSGGSGVPNNSPSGNADQTAPAPGGNVNAQGGGASPDVIIADKTQTFQSILGLK